MPVKKTIEVLLAEGDIFLASIYKKKFELEGLKVRLVSDGKALLKEAQKKKPDIILLDVVLPKEDGFKAMESLKMDPATKNIPIIFLTALGEKADVQKGFALGAQDYLIKNHFRTAEIVDKIKNVLEK